MPTIERLHFLAMPDLPEINFIAKNKKAA